MKRKSSFKSKGFSIPLNASFFLNPVPVSCIQSFSINSKSGEKQRFSSDSSSRLYKAPGCIRSLDNTGSLFSRSADENSCSELGGQEDLDDTLLFRPGDSFNTDEGSCLKELNERLKRAEEKLRNERSLTMKSSRLTKQENVIDDENPREDDLQVI